MIRAGGGNNNYDSWVGQANFAFNPFEHLEASADPFLGKYLIDYQEEGQGGGVAAKIAALISEDAAAVVFAPPGGGKTALRIYVTRACWQRMGGSHPFPIPYVLPWAALDGRAVPFEQHRRWITEAGAAALLVGFSYRPERFLDLAPEQRVRAAQLIDKNLPAGPRLDYLLKVLQESDSPLEMISQLGWPDIITDPPSAGLSQYFAAQMLEALDVESAPLKDDGADSFEPFRQFLLGPLGFRSIFLLVDGIDAFAETNKDADQASRLILPLLDSISTFAEHNIFLKAFIPDTTADKLLRLLPTLEQRAQLVELCWTKNLLADMVRRRVYAASSGAMGSLDALCSPGLRNVENRLAESLTVLLPREMLLLSEKLMEAFSKHALMRGTMDAEDLVTARKLYERSSMLSSVLVAANNMSS